MANPKFSIVIPTRERADTLRFTLRTCLEQKHDNYEIIVCDNCSSPATREVVEEANDKRVRYIRSDTVLAMSSNWELALSQARGEWVSVIGDDDAFLPHALHDLEQFISHTDVRAIRWNAAFYTWPTVALTNQGNYLNLPLGRKVREVKARKVLTNVAAFRTFYTSTPMLYNAVIHHSLVSELRQKAGRVFGSLYPDVYTGIAFAYLAGTYLSMDTPMTISGVSKHSNGIATLFLRKPSPIAQEFQTLNQREQLPTHPWVPRLNIYPIVPVADSFLVAKQSLFPDDAELVIDRKLMVEECLKHLHVESEANHLEVLKAIRDTLADDEALQKWFDNNHSQRPLEPNPQQPLRPSVLGFDGERLHLDTQLMAVTDVHGAVRLCSWLLGADEGQIPYQLVQEEGGPSPLRIAVEKLTTLAARRAEIIEEFRESRLKLMAEVKQLKSTVRQLRSRPWHRWMQRLPPWLARRLGGTPTTTA